MDVELQSGDAPERTNARLRADFATVYRQCDIQERFNVNEQIVNMFGFMCGAEKFNTRSHNSLMSDATKIR